LIVVGGNVARATALFFKETRIVSLPDWTHAGIGVLLFAGCAWLILGLADRLGRAGDPAGREPQRRASSPVATATPWPPWIFRASYFALCGLAAAVPCLAPAPSRPEARLAPDWPAAFEGRSLSPVPLSESEQRFNQAYPGAVARFSDGERQFIFRWTVKPTRKLHSSADCLRGLGYRVAPEPPRVDAAGARWGCFTARRGEIELRVRERIAEPEPGSAGRAGGWSDVSAWYWSALLRQSRGPWLAVTVIEPADE
jgi:hypothetical protein